MATTPLNLPTLLKAEAEQWANRQGISLDELVIWAVAEKLGELKQALDDPRFPHITYRRGVSGWPFAVLRGSGIRVQTIVVSVKNWGMSPAQIAEDYELTLEQVQEALAFCETHRGEIEASLAEERQAEPAHA
jgi:uncharacterized protein (DUF433 family)